MDPFLATVSILLLVVCVLLWPFVNSFLRAPVEKGLKPIWQQRCSGGFRGAGVVGTSLFRVSLYSDFMVMRGFSTIVIPYKNIAEVNWERGFLSFGGVHIRLRGQKSSFVLNPRAPKTFVGILESNLAGH